MEKILEQMQNEHFSHAPGEEMTHVAGVSFVDNVGLSLGAAPREDAGQAGTYRHIANCAKDLEALVLEEEDSQERLERERQGQGQEQDNDDYLNYADGGGHDQHHHSSGRGAHSSTRLRGDDRHIVIERNALNEVAVVVLKKHPEHDSEETEDEDEEEDEGTSS